MGLAKAERDNNLGRFRGTAAAAMANPLYVALLTTNPTDETGTGLVEVGTGVWTNYARQSIASTTGGWNAPTTSNPTETITNAAQVNFGTATISGTAPVITGFALYTAATGGTFEGWGALTSNQTINNGDPVYFNAGQLAISQ